LLTRLPMDLTNNIKTVGNSVGINYMSLYFLALFFFLFFFIVIPSVYTERIFLSVKFTIIYQRKHSVSIAVCIYQFSGSERYSTSSCFLILILKNNNLESLQVVLEPHSLDKNG
jgi:hypothetical protein